MKISIITVCYNSASFLEYTIRSVVGQTYSNWEYIIIDGNSTDDTVHIIKKYEKFIHYWESSEDSGMYDAINKGIAKAKGDYYLVLNSDDFLFAPTSLESAVKYLSKTKPMMAYGNLVKQAGSMQKKVRLFAVDYHRLLFSNHGTFVPHPTLFVSSKLHSQLKSYSGNFKYAADYDYILRALKLSGKECVYIPVYISVFRMHQGSITSSGKIDSERLVIIREHQYYSYSYMRRSVMFILLWTYYKLININHYFIRSNFWA
jgi:glycosyltransferase involved in cell wall biosynthesis